MQSRAVNGWNVAIMHLTVNAFQKYNEVRIYASKQLNKNLKQTSALYSGCRNTGNFVQITLLWKF
jgi:hypothetical protein